MSEANYESDHHNDDIPQHQIITKQEKNEKMSVKLEKEKILQFPVIQNVQCSCDLARPLGGILGLANIARNAINATYAPMSVSGVQIALRNPRAQVTVYASGKMVCLGTRSSIIAVMACRRVARMIQKIQPYEDVKFTQFKVHNILANGAFGYRIDIEQMAEHDDLIEDVDYQPERFGGLHYRLDLLETPETKKKKKQTSHPWSHVYPTGFDSPSSISIQQQTSEPTNIVTCTVFHNGKLTITGARTEDEVYEAFRRMYDICLPFAQDQQNNTFSSDLFEKNLQKYKDEQYASALLVVQEMRHRKKKQFTTETEPENTNVETNWECDETIVQNVEWE